MGWAIVGYIILIKEQLHRQFKDVKINNLTEKSIISSAQANNNKLFLFKLSDNFF